MAARELTVAISRARRAEDSPADVILRLAEALERWLVASDYLEGCPVSTVTLEVAPTHPAITAACREAYERWVGLVVDTLLIAGHTEEQAEALATTVVAGVEGALLLCRAAQDPGPLRTTALQLARLVSRG